MRILAFLLALALTPTVAIAGETLTPPFPEMVEPVKTEPEAVAMPGTTWIVLLRLRYDIYARWKAEEKWPDDQFANGALNGHMVYWHQKLTENIAIMAGGMDGDYWDNTAQIIFRAPDRAAAEAIVAADPAVKAYVFQAQVRPFNISFISNKPSTAK